jgi:hypothetical protein
MLVLLLRTVSRAAWGRTQALDEEQLQRPQRPRSASPTVSLPHTTLTNEVSRNFDIHVIAETLLLADPALP